MSKALSEQLSDAIAAELADALELPARTDFAPQTRLEELSSLQVFCTPASSKSQRTSRRGDVLKTIQVDVALQQRDKTKISALLELLQKIDDHLQYSEFELADEFEAFWESSEHLSGADAGYAADHLRQSGVVTCVLRVQYKVG